ncbi:MAG: PLDc N-terminal domain-containing protein [archaeon]|nr:PLDc N-terminal domain-containing protein [Nanoarchaeota archaeon]
MIEEILYLIFSLGSILISIIGMLLFFAVFLGMMVFWIMMIVDAAQRKFKKEDEKVIWILVLAFAGVIGALIYYIVIKSKDKKIKKK